LFLWDFLVERSSHVRTRQTGIALRATRVVDTLETLSRGPVAVSNGVSVYVLVAVARLALARWPVGTQRVAEVAVATKIAPQTCKSVIPVKFQTNMTDCSTFSLVVYIGFTLFSAVSKNYHLSVTLNLFFNTLSPSNLDVWRAEALSSE